MQKLGAAIILLSLVALGCSGGMAVDIAQPAGEIVQSDPTHVSWGVWQFTADPIAGKLDIVQLRTLDMHLNALPFLEPPPLVNLTLESLMFNGNIIDADIGLRHPFLGLTEFTGFDVCGILITHGGVTGFSDPDIRMAAGGDTRLLNPDGYSRWWNPSEFPHGNNISSYKDGLLGTPDSVAHYNSTLNAYKYFCDDLTADSALDEVSLVGRGMFSAGQKNIRHYTIELGDDGLIFNYAVDASWTFPVGGPPWEAPDDFPPGANRREAWRVDVTETQNALWNDGSQNGGFLNLKLDVYDWYNAGLNSLRVESPGNFDMAESSTPSGSGQGYSTYEIEIADATPAEGEIEILISVISEEENFAGFIPGTNTTAYFTHESAVSDEPIFPCKNITLREGVQAVDIAINHTDGSMLVLYDDKTIYKYGKEDCFANGNLFTTVDMGNEMKYIDIAPNGYFVVAVVYDAYSLGAIIYDPNGKYMIDIVHHPDGPYDVLAFTGGKYMNDLGSVLGVESGKDIITDIPRYADGTWVPAAAYHDYYITDGNTNGVDRVYYKYVKGVETDQTGDYVWFLEDPDYYASRWELYEIGTKGYLEYNKAYFGTGSKSDADDSWNDARDITRDNKNRYFVLDKLSGGDPRVKVWTVNGSETNSIGGFGDSMTIKGEPCRIEGSDYDGVIVVLHGDSPPNMISVFFPDEIPGG